MQHRVGALGESGDSDSAAARQVRTESCSTSGDAHDGKALAFVTGTPEKIDHRSCSHHGI